MRPTHTGSRPPATTPADTRPGTATGAPAIYHRTYTCGCACPWQCIHRSAEAEAEWATHYTDGRQCWCSPEIERHETFDVVIHRRGQ